MCVWCVCGVYVCVCGVCVCVCVWVCGWEGGDGVMKRDAYSPPHFYCHAPTKVAFAGNHFRFQQQDLSILATINCLIKLTWQFYQNIGQLPAIAKTARNHKACPLIILTVNHNHKLHTGEGKNNSRTHAGWLRVILQAIHAPEKVWGRDY